MGETETCPFPNGTLPQWPCCPHAGAVLAKGPKTANSELSQKAAFFVDKTLGVPSQDVCDEDVVGEDVLNANAPLKVSTANLDAHMNAPMPYAVMRASSVCGRDNSHAGLVCRRHQPNIDVTCWGQMRDNAAFMHFTPTYDNHSGLVTSAHQAP